MALEDEKFYSVLEQIPPEDQDKNYTGIKEFRATFTKTLPI